MDNAASTPVDPQVLEAMLPFFETSYGNPSSIHRLGRISRVAVEDSRKKVAHLLEVSPGQILFTSGGTEGNNMVIAGAASHLRVRRFITSRVEHPSVLNSLEQLVGLWGSGVVEYVPIDRLGRIDYDGLEGMLADTGVRTLVSLMHGNNEIGNLCDIRKVAEICASHGGLFHSDAVQTVGLILEPSQDLSADFLVGSAHKFHGPKGVGMVCVRDPSQLGPFIHGGKQERGLRAGTENVPAVVGLAKALELSFQDREDKARRTIELKRVLLKGLRERLEGVSFHGSCCEEGTSLPGLVSLALPPSPKNELLLFNLDMRGIAVSGGSACMSGVSRQSHVLEALGANPSHAVIRFSLDYRNTLEEVEQVTDAISQLWNPSKSSRPHATTARTLGN